MSGRGRASYEKRRKEQARKEKRQQKAEKRAQRKLSPSSGAPIEWEPASGEEAFQPGQEPFQPGDENEDETTEAPTPASTER